uniref:VWFA domain-containing protein n=1 Tax=Macrostomum lignano TaxID=282301 RepID=A0A1I8J5F0_9PLAT
HRHNKDAENLHNKYCHRRSAAEVIRDHEDFLRPINSATTMNSNFNVRLVVEPKRRRVVIVMDISGSMDTDNRLKSLIGAVNHYIAYTLETGSECALISFDHNATVLQNFILVDSPAVRRQLMQSVSNLTTKGWTCIGKAVQEAMKLLGEDPTSPTNRSSGQILLVSDGEENKECSIDLDATIDAIAKTSLRAHTIRFGDLADTRMSILSERTNGHAQLSPVVSDLAASKLILQMTSLQSDLAGVNSIVVLDSRQVPSDLRYPVEFDIGPRSNLVFSLFLPSDPAKVGSLRLMLRSPSGRTFNCSGGSSTVCTVDVAVGSVTMQIPDAEVEYRMYAVVEAGNTEVARFDIFEQHGKVPVYSLRYEESGDNCTDVNSYYSCPELAVTNQSSVNIYSQYMALNEPPMWIAVIAISAANVPSLSRSLLYIQDKKPLAAEDEKRLGLLPSTVTKSSQRTKTSMPWYGGHGTKASMSAARSSTMTMLSRPYKFPHLHLNAPKIFSNDSNKAKSTTKFTANSMANSTTKSSAQLNVDLAWLNAGTVCSLAVLTVSAQHAAEVIRDHEDFLRPISSATIVNSKFNFRLVVEPKRDRVVIVMDTSSSMRSDNRMQNLINAVNNYIAFTLKTGGKWTLTNLAVGLARRIRRQAASTMTIVITGRQFALLPRDTTCRVKPNNVTMVKYDTRIGVFVNLLPRSQIQHKYQMYAVVTASNKEVARFNLSEQYYNRGAYSAMVPLYAVQKARQYAVDVFITFPFQMQLSGGTLTVQAEDPNFDRRRIVPKPSMAIYISRKDYASKIIEIKWNPVKDPSDVPVYSLRYRETGGNCTAVNGYYSCPELAVTNQSSLNIYNQYMALNEPPMFIKVIAISAANVSSVSIDRLYIQDEKPLAAEDEKRLGLLPSTMARTLTSTTKQLTSHVHRTVAQTLANDPNKTNSTAKSSSRNSTQTKSSAQLKMDLAWLSAGAVCSLAVLTVSAQQWLIQ